MDSQECVEKADLWLCIEYCFDFPVYNVSKPSYEKRKRFSGVEKLDQGYVSFALIKFSTQRILIDSLSGI